MIDCVQYLIPDLRIRAKSYSSISARVPLELGELDNSLKAAYCSILFSCDFIRFFGRVYEYEVQAMRQPTPEAAT